MVGLNKVVCDCVLWRSGSHWYAGNWKSCNVCRIFSVKAIFETRESRPKLISSTREQNFQKCPALMLQQLYNSPTTSVKWKSKVSNSFNINQGVRQGGASSAPIYKCYTASTFGKPTSAQGGHYQHLSPNLCRLHGHPSQPTWRYASCYWLGRETYVGEHHYGINSSKSATLAYNTQLQPSFIMKNSEIPYSIDYTHLGVVRNQSSQLNTDERIQLPRRTLYALMGGGVHGKDGLYPQISHHIWSTYVIPRMLYRELRMQYFYPTFCGILHVPLLHNWFFNNVPLKLTKISDDYFKIEGYVK